MGRRKTEEKILDVSAAMQGSLIFSDPVNLRINGKFEGSLTTKGVLIIGANADIKANICGEDVTIAGMVKGNIMATESLTLSSTAKVLGDIEAPLITIEKGAAFNGKCRMSQGKISLGELSDYLSVGEKKIMEWVEDGKIPVEKNGSQFLFDRAQVEDWIAHKV